jgi:hypothetical protein
MEIVVTAPTPMIQSPVSEEEDFEGEAAGDEVEKGDNEDMEKSTEPAKNNGQVDW